MLLTQIVSMSLCLVAFSSAAPLPMPVPTDLFFPGFTTAALTVGIPSFTIPAVTLSGGAIASALAAKGIIAAGVAKGAALAQLTRDQLQKGAGDSYAAPYQQYHH